MLKTFSGALLLILTTAALSASAQTFIVNASFINDTAAGFNSTLSGTFTTDSTFTVLQSWNVSLNGSTHNFNSSSANEPPSFGELLTPPAPGACGGGDVQEIVFGFTISLVPPKTTQVTLCLSTLLNANGATVDLANAFSCDETGKCAPLPASSASITPEVEALISYAANLKAGDSKINLTNAGTNGGNDATDSICANVYVFAEDQQLIECCTCPLTPNHLRTLSVQNDLINNTLTPGVPIGITMMLVASAGGACNAATVTPANTVGGLLAWGTTLHAAPGGGFAVTENHFLNAVVSPSELAKMTQFCGFIQADGSKFGICSSCKDGAAGAQKQ
jgi:hypothetical protein